MAKKNSDNWDDEKIEIINSFILEMRKRGVKDCGTIGSALCEIWLGLECVVEQEQDA